jgi:hypothetical protein
MYSGWHFTADRPGCESMVALIDVLTSGGAPSHRTLLLADPTPFGADRIYGPHELRVVHPAKLRLAFNGSRTGGDAELVEEEERLSLTLGAADMNTLAEAIRDVRRDHADFTISFDSRVRDDPVSISFWWWPRGK